MTKLKIGSLYEYDRNADGVEMIAISSRGRTPLGRGLAAGAHLPSTHPTFGSFKSMAGFIRYVCGDRREFVRGISGVEFDDALLDSIPVQYEDVVQDHFMRVLTEGRAQELKLHAYLHANTLPCFLYQDVDGDMIPVRTPAWFTEVLERLAKRVPVAYVPPRSLKELQDEFQRLHANGKHADFWVTQAEFDSLPEAIRTAMGSDLKIKI